MCKRVEVPYLRLHNTQVGMCLDVRRPCEARNNLARLGGTCGMASGRRWRDESSPFRQIQVVQLPCSIYVLFFFLLPSLRE